MSIKFNTVKVNCPVCSSNSFKKERSLHGYSLVKCNCCKMVYCNPRPSEKTLVDAYKNLKEKEFDDFFGTEEIDLNIWLKQQSKKQIKNYRRNINKIKEIIPKGKLLDIGCSNGRFLEIASKYEYEPFGVEVMHNSSEKKKKLNIFEGTLETASYDSNFFDVIFSQAVLEHLVYPEKTVQEIYRILKPGGLLVLAGIPNYHSLLILLNRDKFIGNKPPNHLNYFTVQTLSKLLDRYNFNVIKKQCWGVSETALFKLGWEKAHIKNKQNIKESEVINILGKLFYNKINLFLNLFNVGSVIELYCIKK